jgi:DNA mismatch endonuclease (patch repair protein)
MERLLKRQLPGGVFFGVTPQRSLTMGKIKSKGNRTTEQSFRLALVRAGIQGWVLHPKQVFGTPDFYFPTKKVAIFVDGCFWHGCPKCGHIPRTRSAFWRTKIERNRTRTKSVSRRLRGDGIRVLRIWEHELQEAA